MVNQSPVLLQERLEAFIRFRQEHLQGDEKGQAQVFCDRLFQAFGHDGLHEAGASLEFRIKKADAKGTAFADLMWKPRCLIEMKKAGTDLNKHYRQAFDYWVQAVPDRPRFVVLCNFDEFYVYDFDQQLDAPMDRIRLVDLPARWEALSFLQPADEAPIFKHNLVAVTRDAAALVARVFTGLEERGVDAGAAQRFVLQCVMAMFAEDIGLLPAAYFTRAVDDCLDNGGDPYDLIFGLFREMNSAGVTSAGRFRGTPYFNGGLFAEILPVSLELKDLFALRAAAATNWAFVRPEIFGTLFEGSMAEGERHASGAHFTSQADIMRVIGPTIVKPWRDRIAAAGTIPDLERLLAEMLNFRVLDPACGSGNFLYVAYREMRRLEAEILERIDERRTSKDKAAQRAFAYVTPDHFYGIDQNPFAVEVAKVTMMLAKKLSADELDATQDVLPLDSLDDSIIAGDALFMAWPRADVIVGNPPYLGRRKMVEELGSEYCQRLADEFPQVSGVSDFVSYWFPLTHDRLRSGGRAGFVATNTVRQNDTREVTLDYIEDNGGVIFDAVSSQPWSGDAAVHVSVVNWAKGDVPPPHTLWLNNGQLRLEVDTIPTSLSPDVDVRRARDLACNMSPKTCFQGQTPGVTAGYTLNATERDELLARKDGSAFFVHPFLGGEEVLSELEITRWVIDIPETDLLVAQAAAPAAMKRLAELVLPRREELRDREVRRNAEGAAANPKFRPADGHQKFMDRWWHMWRRRSDMLDKISVLDRYIALTIVANEKRASAYQFVDATVRPTALLQVFTFDDDYSFGILSSSVHRTWFEARCSTLENRLRYTPQSVYNSFPWPQTPTDEDVAGITRVVAQILEQRQTYFERGISLKKQYDALRADGASRLKSLHAELDAAVLQAYAFSESDPLLAQILALNLDLAELATARGPGGAGLAGARVTDYRFGP